MTPSSENKKTRCLVLGGTGHVGQSVCAALAATGADVYFTYWKNLAKARDMQQMWPGMRAVPLDGRDFSAVKNAITAVADEMGGLDALIHCVGTAGAPELYAAAENGADKFLTIDEAAYREMMDVTVASAFAACQTFAALKGPQGGGNVVLAGSMDGVKAVPAPIHYAAAKGAIAAMTRALAKELKSRGVLVNHVALGVLDGGIASLLSEELKRDYIKHGCVKRVGTGAEAGEFIAWLATENTALNGETIILDGGL